MKILLVIALFVSFAANAAAPVKHEIRRHHGIHFHKMKSGRFIFCNR